jgi:hypothetical protein
MSLIVFGRSKESEEVCVHMWVKGLLASTGVQEVEDMICQRSRSTPNRSERVSAPLRPFITGFFDPEALV